MGRWTYQDEDSYRLPEGFTRIAYDADSRVYTYRDEEGRLYEGAPGASYGLLTPLAAPPRSTRNKHAQTSVVGQEEAGRAVSSIPTPTSVSSTIRKTRDIIPPTTAGTTSRRATMPARSNRVTRSTSDGAPTLQLPTPTTQKAHDTTTTSRRATVSARDNRMARSASESSLPELPAPKPPTTKAHKTLDAPRMTSSASGGSFTAMSRRATIPARSGRIPDSILNKPTPRPPTTTRETRHTTPHTPPTTSSRLGEFPTKSKQPATPLENDWVTGSTSVESSLLKSKSLTVKSHSKTMHKRSHTTSHILPANSSPSGGSPTTTSRRATIPPRNDRGGSHTLKSKSSTKATRKRHHTTSHTPPAGSSPPNGSSTRYERGTILPRNIRRLLGALGIMRRRADGADAHYHHQ